MKPQRIAKIDHEIQRILGTLISQELRDPRLAFVTVTRVEVSDDFSARLTRARARLQPLEPGLLAPLIDALPGGSAD